MRPPGQLLPAACGQSHIDHMTAPMRSLVLALLALCALVGSAAGSGPARADPVDIAAASRSVVRVVLIGTDEDGEPFLIGHGSGFAIGPGLIMTNAHVVAPSRDDETIRIGVVPPQGKSGSFATVVAFSAFNDLALLKLNEAVSLPPIALFTGPVGDGSDVYAVGYPGNVDFAQGLNAGDLVSPISPVKTHGTVSAGRSSKQFDTILHTASIGAGNSGGPLLDPCGRVIGVNSFGTESAHADSNFYFAVSTREIMRFLMQAGVTPESTGAPCRSIAEFDREDADRLAAGNAEAARSAAAKQAATIDAARLQAQSDVITERENAMALAGLAILFALAAGGAAVFYKQQQRPREVRIAAIAGGALLVAAILSWITRPPLSQIESRAQDLVQAQAKASPTPAPSASQQAGLYICVLDTARSRVTVSPLTDVPFRWTADGCVNGRTQYGLGNSGWSRVLVPKEDQTATLASFDPASGTYRTERYLLDLDTMQQLRAARGKFTAPSCGDGDAAARRLGAAEGTLRALLPATPQERLVYDCKLGGPAG
jgi:serine protease Do